MRTVNLFIIIVFFSTISTVAQENRVDHLTLDKIDNWYELDDYLTFFEDPSHSISFEEVIEEKFYPVELLDKNPQATYWYRTTLIKDIAADSLQLYFYSVDKTEVFVPIGLDDYKKHLTGALAQRDEPISRAPKMYFLTIPTDAIDFERPFYYNKTAITPWGYNNLEVHPDILLTRDGMAVENMLLRSDEGVYHFLLGITFISFLLFMVSYFVSNDKSFLLYSLYLFFVTLYYANRLPFLINFYSGLEPKLYYYVNQITHIINIGLYVYFVVYFLDFKNNFPKVYSFSKKMLWGITIFGLLYSSLMVVYPFFPFRFLAMDLFRAIFTVLSLGIFTYIMFKKPNLVATIILIGSLLLIIGNVIALLVGDFTFFLKMVVVEIVIFSAVVSFKNKINEKARLKSKYALAVEQKEKESLLELDASKSKFFQNISHEFRTPLTLIKSPISEAIRTKKPLDDKMLSIIENNTKRLQTLIDDLLALSKIESGDLQLRKKRCQPFKEAHRIAHQFDSYASEKDISLSIAIQERSISALLDLEVLEKTMVNLITNAIKYAGDNTAISVKVHKKDSTMQIIVEDDGIGIPIPEQDRIFDRFYQVDQKDEQTPGSGIGLALVIQLIELHGGTITLKSEEGKGSTFTATIPLEHVKIEEPEPHMIQESVVPNSSHIIAQVDPFKFPEKETLLIVEDNADLQFYMYQEFKEHYRVFTAANGSEGFEIALIEVPDLIISDWMMPVMNGITLCKKIKGHNVTSHIPFILLTAKATVRDTVEGFETGADAYIAKPFNTEALKAQTLNLIQQRKGLKEKYSSDNQIVPKNLSTNKKDQEFWDHIVLFLEQNLNDPELTVEQMAREFTMSRMQLHRKLKGLTGLSATEFIRSQRIKLASRLLEDPNITVAEVAFSVGYNDASVFSRAFKKDTGTAPSVFQAHVSRG